MIKKPKLSCSVREHGKIAQKNRIGIFLSYSEKAASPDWKAKVRDKLYELELASDAIISSIIHTPKNLENLTVTPLYQIIVEEGIAV